jgi:hypothetical protein
MNSNVIKPPIGLKTAEHALDGGSPAIDSLPFFAFGKQQFFMRRIDLNDWLRPILPFYVTNKLLAGVSSVTNDKLGTKSPIDESSMTQDSTGCTYISEGCRSDVGGYREFALSISQEMKLIAVRAATIYG